MNQADAQNDAETFDVVSFHLISSTFASYQMKISESMFVLVCII